MEANQEADSLTTKGEEEIPHEVNTNTQAGESAKGEAKELEKQAEINKEQKQEEKDKAIEKEKDYADHLLILQHGLHGNERDFDYFKLQMEKQYKGLKVVWIFLLFLLSFIPYLLILVLSTCIFDHFIK